MLERGDFEDHMKDQTKVGESRSMIDEGGKRRKGKKESNRLSSIVVPIKN